MHASSFAVLRLLADGRMRTRAEIGVALALSRRMVERALREIGGATSRGGNDARPRVASRERVRCARGWGASSAH